MICMYADSHLCTFTFILYTCICIPLRHTTQSLVKIFSFLFNPHNQLSQETPSCNLQLPVSRFRNLECRREATHDEEEEVCSICLVELEKQDLVNKLGRCGHTFHVECMEKWLDTCRFTCPLCRSNIFTVRSRFNSIMQNRGTSWSDSSSSNIQQQNQALQTPEPEYSQ